MWYLFLNDNLHVLWIKQIKIVEIVLIHYYRAKQFSE